MSAPALWLRGSQDQGGDALRIPAGTGIAGTALASGRGMRVANAHADPRFNPEMARRAGVRTRSVLRLPVKDRDGGPFAAARLLNRNDGRPFDEADETQL